MNCITRNHFKVGVHVARRNEGWVRNMYVAELPQLFRVADASPDPNPYVRINKAIAPFQSWTLGLPSVASRVRP